MNPDEIQRYLASKEGISREDVAELVRSPDTYGIIGLALLWKFYGPEAHKLDSLEIIANFQDDFRATPSEELMNRICALQSYLDGEETGEKRFYDDPEVFYAIVSALRDGTIDDVMDGIMDEDSVSSVDLLWALYEISLLTDLSDEEPAAEVEEGEFSQFSPSVKKLIAEIRNTDGDDSTGDLPKILQICEEERLDLVKQFAKFGVSESMIPHIV